MKPNPMMELLTLYERFISQTGSDIRCRTLAVVGFRALIELPYYFAAKDSVFIIGCLVAGLMPHNPRLDDLNPVGILRIARATPSGFPVLSV
jgi:hypothetical protein